MYEIPIEDFYQPGDGNDYLPAWNRAMQSINIPAGPLSGRIPDGRALVFGPQEYYFSDTIIINRILTIRGAHGGGQFSPTRFRFPENKTGIHVAHVFEVPNPNGRGDNTVIEKINIVSDGGDLSEAHGLEIRARVTVRDVYISNFPGNGLNAVTDMSSERFPNDTYGTTNTNSSLFIHLWVEKCKQDNVFIQGANANQMLFIGLSVDGSINGWGVNDESFLGNTYIAPHSSYNAAGSYRSVPVDQESWDQKAGMWLSPYAEEDQPPADIRWPSMVIGGIGIRLAPGAKPDPARIDNSGFMVTFPFAARSENRDGRNIVEGVLGSPDVGNVAFEFKSDGDTGKVFEGDRIAGGPYRLQFDNDDKRWWLTYVDNEYGRPIGFTTNTSVERGTPIKNNAYPVLPRGYYLGASPDDKRWIKVSVSGNQPITSIPGKLGDQIYNINPVSGGHVGWVFTADGWKPFGKIER